MNILYPLCIAAIFWMIVVISSYFVEDKNRHSPSRQQAVMGLMWGAIAGSIMFPSATLALLLYALKDESRGGDAVVGAGGLVIIAIPAGFLIGGISGSLFVAIKKYFKQRNR